MEQKYICGKNSVLDAIENGIAIKKIYAIKLPNFNTRNIKIKIVSKHFLDNLTDLNHQGIVAILEERFDYHDFEKMIKEKPDIILVLDHIMDPQNLGAILRVANGSGVNNIILPRDRSAQINDVVLKVSSGGFAGLNISRVNSLQSALEKLKNIGYWIYASAIEKGNNFQKIKYNLPMVIVVGNEAKGVSKTILNISDQNIFIPMYGSVQSLNVSVATGILLYEIIKHKNF
ncbi:23S rRNA (guanosine(2251)-2'-O)-methyltransferase RlmB [Mesomycoplasma moatsii]|uniref:23S rRNA (guanosine(2251)-2'-O)-methyltransferase RlmB n=1 Tax=Mesomycoplasma moatsii TaxID=171287 RepID=UPI0003B2E6C4